jgi:hypothetical protein
MEPEEVNESVQALLQRAETLRPLLDSPAFREFMKTISEDLEEYAHRRRSTPITADNSPAIIVFTAIEEYQRELLDRVKQYVDQAAKVAMEESSGA